MRFTEYVKETKVELKHVSWPTRRQAVTFTFLVIAASVFTAIYLGLFDYLFKLVLEQVI